MGLTGAPGQRDRWPQPTWAVGQLRRDQDRYSEKGGHRGTEVTGTAGQTQTAPPPGPGWSGAQPSPAAEPPPCPAPCPARRPHLRIPPVLRKPRGRLPPLRACVLQGSRKSQARLGPPQQVVGCKRQAGSTVGLSLSLGRARWRNTGRGNRRVRRTWLADHIQGGRCWTDIGCRGATG